MQYAEANQSRYNQLLSSIEQNCILGEEQTISDMLYVVQEMIQEDTGEKFKLESIGIRAKEILTQNEEKARCDEFFAGIATLMENRR